MFVSFRTSVVRGLVERRRELEDSETHTESSVGTVHSLPNNLVVMNKHTSHRNFVTLKSNLGLVNVKQTEIVSKHVDIVTGQELWSERDHSYHLQSMKHVLMMLGWRGSSS